MTTTTETAVATQVYRLYVKASPQAIWDAITTREWAERYGYAAPVEYELRPGGAFRGFPSEAMAEHGASEVIIEGEVLEADPPHRLVQTWDPLFCPEIVDEPPTRLTWEIEEVENGVSTLTLTHELEDAPKTATMVAGAPGTGGGWSFVLSDLKTLLETGSSLGI
jgi:uncharacterized protein YndB with AHSA1/START domain